MYSAPHSCGVERVEPIVLDMHKHRPLCLLHGVARHCGVQKGAFKRVAGRGGGLVVVTKHASSRAVLLICDWL